MHEVGGALVGSSKGSSASLEFQMPSDEEEAPQSPTNTEGY